MIGSFFLIFLLTLWFLGGSAVYLHYLKQAVAGNGRIRYQHFSRAEAAVAMLLISLAIYMIAGFITKQTISPSLPENPSSQAIVESVLLDTQIKLLLVGGLLLGLAWRGVYPVQGFGLDKLSFRAVLGNAVFFLIAALPLTWVTITIVQYFIGTDSPQEEAIRLLTASHDLAPRIAMIAAAVVAAPVIEEFIFRGYLYGVLRRYLGVRFGIVINSILFAGIHLHLPSFAPLFVLAFCLTIAYEATGSLLVPMTMHALFNAISVAAIILGIS